MTGGHELGCSWFPRYITDVPIAQRNLPDRPSVSAFRCDETYLFFLGHFVGELREIWSMAVVTREHSLEALKQVVDTDKGGDVVTTLLPVMAIS